jgi:hypothetical protein
MGRLKQHRGLGIGLGLVLLAVILAGIQGHAVAQEAGHHPNRVYIGQDGNLYINGASVYNDANADISASLEVLNSLTATELGYMDAVTLGTVTASKSVTVNATKDVGDFNDVGLGDDGELQLGAAAGGDVNILWSDADASNHALVVALDDTAQQAHVTDKAAKATDWARSAGTHPELAIHSNTTPATDYLSFGNHDGTNASIDMVGGTGLDILIDGVGLIRMDDAAVSGFAAATDTVGQDTYLETQDAGGTATAARVGGLLNIKTGDGSAGAAAVIAGAGGASTFTTGAGGGASGTAAGGASGALTLSSAAGGAHTGGGATGAGGAGGAVALTAGAGGATSNVGANNGGNGAGVTVTAGVGGLASAGTGDGGNGGDITLTPGSGGTSAGGVAGVPGKVSVTTGVVHFAVQTIDMADAALTLTLVPGTPTGTLMTGNILYVDANSAGNENLLLPHEADSTGIFLIVINTGGETINLQNDAGGAVLTIAATENGFATCDGTTWMGSTGVL